MSNKVSGKEGAPEWQMTVAHGGPMLEHRRKVRSKEQQREVAIH